MASPRVIILGAGLYGLAAAKAYLRVRPNVALTIIDNDSSIGGVWSKKRVHAGLTVDSPVTLFEFSDLPMRDVKELELEDWAQLPSDKMHRYLEIWAEKHDILRRTRLNTEVLSIRRNDGWDLDLMEDGKAETVHCDRLIVASGVYSDPFLPKLDMSKFAGKAIHSKVLGEHVPFLSSPEVSKVTIVGSGKSAVDSLMVCAHAGKTVDWVLREDGKGRGPSWIVGLRNKGRPLAKLKQLRVGMIVSPNLFQKDSFLSWLLFKTSLGIQFMKAMTGRISRTALARFDNSSNGRLIKPKTKEYVLIKDHMLIDRMFYNTHVAPLQDMTDFWRLIEEGKQVHVYRDEIDSFNGKQIKLASGEVLESDAIIFSTGWQDTHVGLFEYPKQADYGLPVQISDEDPKDWAAWTQQVEKADSEILHRFPILKDAPSVPPPSTTPFRLYRQLVPPKLAASGDRSLAFLGVLINTFATTAAEVSALWVVAYLEGLLPEVPTGILSDQDAMDRSIAEHHAWITRRYNSPARPRGGMEIQAWIDTLIADLDCTVERRGKGAFGWFRENCTPYICRDFAGLTEEFMEKVEARKTNTPEE